MNPSRSEADIGLASSLRRSATNSGSRVFGMSESKAAVLEEGSRGKMGRSGVVGVVVVVIGEVVVCEYGF